MKHGWYIVLMVLLVSCGGAGDSTDNYQIDGGEKEEEKAVKASMRVDLENKGVGPVQNLSLPEEIDEELAQTGEGLFKSNCTVCHKIDSRFVGPALKGVTARRTPEWIMNMILNTEYMLRDDPLAKELFMEFNGSPMNNVGFEEEEARAVLEYLRLQSE